MVTIAVRYMKVCELLELLEVQLLYICHSNFYIQISRTLNQGVQDKLLFTSSHSIGATFFRNYNSSDKHLSPVNTLNHRHSK